MYFKPILFGLLSAGLVSTQDLPQFGINIAPTFHQENASVAHLDLHLRVRDPSAKENRTPLYMNVNHSLTPNQRYDGDALTVADDQGELPFTYSDANGSTRNWLPTRDPVGDILVTLSAQHRGDVDNLSGRADLRYDRAGAMGQGHNFIPYPPSHELWNITVTWDIPKSALAETRFTSALGDMQESTETGYPDRLVGDSMFAVGPLQRWPSWEQVDITHPSEEGPVFAMYWIGDLPYDTEVLANDAERVYRGTAKYFGSEEHDYRVFFRLDFKAYGGQGGYKSFVLEYNEGAEKDNTVKSFENLLSHEIIHSFALTYPGDDWEKWYVEGSAEYLKSVAPFIGGGLNKTTFVDWLNGLAQDYYTASSLGKRWEWIITDYWTKSNAAVKTPYSRGGVFFAYLQGQVVTGTDGAHSVDDVIIDLYHKYVNGDTVRTPEILEVVAKYVGAEAAQASYDSFANGALLVPDAGGFANSGLKLVRKDLKKLDIGMSQNSPVLGIVNDLVAGSRANQAGLREGDKIVNIPSIWAASDTHESKIKFNMERDGTTQDIEYWPRSDELVEAYQWVDSNE